MKVLEVILDILYNRISKIFMADDSKKKEYGKNYEYIFDVEIEKDNLTFTMHF